MNVGAWSLDDEWACPLVSIDFNFLSNAMRNNILTIFMSVFIVVLLSGCDKKFLPVLRETDRLLSSDSKRGEAMLDSICKIDRNMPTADKKYSQLLRLKADDKAYRPIEKWKGCIDTLVSYFEHAGDEDLLAESYFYAGRVYYEIGDKPESLKFYQKASEKVAKDNYALQGDIYCQMANIYFYKGLYKSALESLEKSRVADSLSGNIRNMLYDIRDIGENYYYRNKIEEAKSYFEKGLKESEMQKDTFMLKAFHHKLATVYGKRKNWQKALFHVNQYIYNMDDFPDKSALLITALDVYGHIGNVQMAEKCRNWLLIHGNIYAKQETLSDMLLAMSEKQNDLVLRNAIQQYVLYTDSVMDEGNAETVKKVELSYNYNLKENENQYLRSMNVVKTIGLALTVVIVLLFSLFFYMRIKNIRQYQKILELKLDKYNGLNEKNEIKANNQKDKMQSIMNSDIYRLILKEIESDKFHLAEDDWNDLKRTVNDVYSNFDKNLFSFLKVSSQEYRICLLLKVGVTPSNIAKFMNRTKEAITASRRRMYKKAFDKDGTPTDWDNLVRSL